jgi:transcriptional regulator with XRE-family HTH domain
MEVPILVRGALRKLGSDIRAARVRRRVPMHLMAERAAISRGTLSRVEQGDPGVCLGTYAIVLSELGIGERVAGLADVKDDRVGLMLEEQRLPKRVRLSKSDMFAIDPEIGTLDYKALVADRQKSREDDEALLKSGAISQKDLQRRNSMIPAGAVARILSLPDYCIEPE